MLHLRLKLTLPLLLSLGLGTVALAAPINPGFDLFSTPPGGGILFGGTIPGIPGDILLVGLPIGPGNTDTIVERKTGLADGATGPIQAELVALSLMSISPVSFMGSFFDVFVTLDATKQSKGVINVQTHGPNGGTFDSFFDVFAEVTLSEVGNPSNSVTQSHADQISSSGSMWSHTAPPGYPSGRRFPSGGFYPGVNPDTREIAPVMHTGPHPRSVPATPEPATWMTLGSAILFAAAYWRRKQ